MKKLKLENIFERMDLDFMTEDMDEQLQDVNDLIRMEVESLYGTGGISHDPR